MLFIPHQKIDFSPDNASEMNRQVYKLQVAWFSNIKNSIELVSGQGQVWDLGGESHKVDSAGFFCVFLI
jgi:hypothetical protein